MAGTGSDTGFVLRRHGIRMKIKSEWLLEQVTFGTFGGSLGNSEKWLGMVQLVTFWLRKHVFEKLCAQKRGDDWEEAG